MRTVRRHGTLGKFYCDSERRLTRRYKLQFHLRFRHNGGELRPAENNDHALRGPDYVWQYDLSGFDRKSQSMAIFSNRSNRNVVRDLDLCPGCSHNLHFRPKHLQTEGHDHAAECRLRCPYINLDSAW